MTSTIFNPDGSVYMTFPLMRQSREDLEGYMVRTITSVDNPPSSRLPGTYALTNTSAESERGVMFHVSDYGVRYGRRADMITAFGVRDSKGRRMHYRWTWEWLSDDGHRQSDTVIVSRIPE